MARKISYCNLITFLTLPLKKKTFLTEATFEVENFGETCYLYECISAMRALFLQRTAPTKYKKVIQSVIRFLPEEEFFIML